MNTQLNTQSPQPGAEVTASAFRGGDWKAQFRLNVLDLNPKLNTSATRTGWITNTPALKQLIDRVQEDIVALNHLIQATGESGIASDYGNVLGLLGIHEEDQPTTLLAHLRLSITVLTALIQFHRHAARIRYSLRTNTNQ